MWQGMRVQPTLPAIWRESLRASVEGIGAPGKSSDSADPGAQRRDPDAPARKTRPRLQVELVCQDGTKAHDPFRDAPRLNPAFVTQLLGQVMAGAERPAPRRSYGTNATGAALMFDARA